MNIPFREYFDRRATFHVPAVVSICTDLKPNIFTVVLSGGGADKGRRTIRFLTDERSKRCDQLQSNHSLAVNFYDEAKKV